MGSIAIPRLYEALREATDAADAEVDAHFYTVLRNVDLSTEPISSSLLVLRQAAREATIKRIRCVMARHEYGQPFYIRLQSNSSTSESAPHPTQHGNYQ